MRAASFNSAVITTLNAAAINAAGTNTRETKNTLISYFSRVQYNFNNRYLLSASIRRDGSSRFGPDTKWAYSLPFLPDGVFPKKNFMKEIGFISSMKLRGSWGISGNNGIGAIFHASVARI